MKFRYESEMSEQLQSLLLPLIKKEGLSLFAEVDGLLGRPDFLVIKKSEKRVSYVIAVEVKLRAWRRALSQATKNRNFSNESYVILDYENIDSALKNKRLFINSGIGLASFSSNGTFQIHLASRPLLPLSLYLSKRLASLHENGLEDKVVRHAFQRSTLGRRSFSSFDSYVVN